MLSGSIAYLLTRERGEANRRGAEQHELLDRDRTPVTRVTLRYAGAADAQRLRRLAELDSTVAPTGPALVAEVDGRLRAALPLDGAPPIADPFHRGTELIELLRLRAAQLA
jgi:hypothetical protein